MKGLNLAEMKKVSEDKDSATFKHKDGHTIKVATKALSPAMKKELAKLPVHAAEGDDVQSQEPHALPGPTDPTVGIPEDAANVALQSAGIAPKEQASLADVPQSEPQEAQQQQPAREPAAAKKMPDVTPPQAPDNAVSPGQQNLFKTPEQNKQEMSKEQAAWQSDLNNGHIEPKTYQSLYAKQDTLGKIGTIFGLLIGGAGAGLSHQPNLLMEMMGKEIDRDLEAQKQSKLNAQNFYKLNQERLNNEVNRELTRSQIPLTEQQTKSLKIETDMKAYALAQSQMLQASYHQLVTNVNKMSEGPQKEQAKSTLGMLYMKMGEKINNINDLVAGATAFGNAFNSGQGAGSEQDFQNKNSMLKLSGPEGGRLSHELESHHVPGAPGQTSIPVSGEDRTRIESMNVLDDKVRDVLDFAKKHTGTVDPQTRARAKQKAEELIAFYNKSVDSLGMTPGRLEWLEKQVNSNPTSIIEQVLGSNERLREIRDSNVGRRDTLMQKYGGKEYPKKKNEEDIQTEERFDPARGKNAIYDAKTKKFLRWK